jgi:hypothetical protein
MNEYYINRFINEYCELQNIDRSVLFSKRRNRELVEIRMILAFFLRNRTKLTWQAIGKIMKKNHASIIHYTIKIEQYLDVYPHLQRMFKETNNLFKSYKHLIEKETDIYSQLLIDNEKLKNKIESNEKLIKQLINLEKNGQEKN